jgi:hypothetical protein
MRQQSGSAKAGSSSAIRNCRKQPREQSSLSSGLAALGLTLASMPCAVAAVFTVTSAGDPGAAGLSLRQAVAMANSPSDVVEFDPSLVGSTITLTQGYIYSDTGVTIVGPGADKLTISAGNATEVLRINFAHEVAAAPSEISGLTLTGGAVTLLGGGAIYASDSSVYVHDSVVTGNSGRFGAIYVRGLQGDAITAHFKNVVVSNNSGAATGVTSVIGLNGASDMTASIENCTISSNPGGAIYAGQGVDVTVSGSIISGNGGSSGGAIRAYKSKSLTVTYSTISGNSSVGDGGGIWSNGTPVTIAATRITGNTAGGDGGGMLLTGSGIVQVTASEISANSAYDYGGGIDVRNSTSLTIQRSLISGNQLTDFTSGARGGGLALQHLSGTTTISNSTFYRNFAYEGGGGIGIFDATTGNNTSIVNSTIAKNTTFVAYSNGILGAGQPAIDSSIIANNYNAYQKTQDLVGDFKVSYSLIKNPSAATIAIFGDIFNILDGTDPLLGPLAVNGGPTRTMLPAAGSPVLDKGNPDIACCVDQRGVPRVFNGEVDMGAVERQTPEVMVFLSGFD